MWTDNFQMYKLDLEKAEEPEIKLLTSLGSQQKQVNSRKNIYFCFIDNAKSFLWLTTNCGKFLKKREYQTTLSASWEIWMQVKRQQLEADIEKWMDWFKIGKVVHQGCILSPCLFNLYAE